MKKIDLNKLTAVLPRHPGILGKQEYFNSAVLIPIIELNGVSCFLFEKRSAKIRQGGEICFPGGEYDPKIDKSIEDTAIRETIEELGITKDIIFKIGYLDTFVGPMGVTVDSIIAKLELSDLNAIIYDKNEVERIFTVPVSFFLENPPEVYGMRLELHTHYLNDKGEKIDLLPVRELGLPERYSGPRQGKKHNVYVYKKENEIIWGITAALIFEFINKISETL